MKTILIVRHGEAENTRDIAPEYSGKNSAAIAGLDRDRSLTPRGVLDVMQMGLRLKPWHRAGQPIAVSSAVRTLETATSMAMAWGRESGGLDVREEGYLADYLTWMRWMAGWPDEAETGWIVGHNPGLTALIYHITGEDIILPPCGAAEITCNVNRWVEVSGGIGKLQALLTPH